MDASAYYFVAADGRRGDVIRCQTYQPGVEDDNDYVFFMWVEAVQGYFVLQQRFLEGKAQNWQLIGEMERPSEGPSVFEEFCDFLVARHSHQLL